MTHDPLPGSAATPEPTIRLTWTVTNQYQREFTPQQWADGMEWFGDDLDPTDLDACYERLERQDFKAEEFMNDAASDRYWVDTQECQVSDLEATDAE